MRIVLTLLLSLAFGAAASAQMTTTKRVRGTIVSLSGEALVVAPAEGPRVSVVLAVNHTVVAAAPIQLADIKPGAFIGSAALRQPDGSLRAIEVHVFPEAMRGTGEGYRPWDLGPQSTMTNGSVGRVAGHDGRDLTIDYAGGQQVVTVPPDAPVLAYAAGTPALLVPGAAVVINATSAADGSLHADRVTVATGGAKLAM